LPLHEWGLLSPEDRAASLAKFVSQPVDSTELEAELDAYEKRFGMTTAEMKTRLKAGLLRESLDVCHWVIAAEAAGRE